MATLEQLIDAHGFTRGMQLWHAQNEQIDAAIELLIMERRQWTNAAVDAWVTLLPFKRLDMPTIPAAFSSIDVGVTA